MLPFLPAPLTYFLNNSKLASVHSRLPLAKFTQGLQVLSHIRSFPLIQKKKKKKSLQHFMQQTLSIGITLLQLLSAPHFLSQLLKEDHIPCCLLLLHTAQSCYGLTWLKVCLYIDMSNSICSQFTYALSLTDLFHLITL